MHMATVGVKGLTGHVGDSWPVNGQFVKCYGEVIVCMTQSICVVSGLSDYGESTGRTQGSGPRATLIVCPLSTMSSWLVRLTLNKLVPETGTSRLVQETCTCVGQSGTSFLHAIEHSSIPAQKLSGT